MADESKHKELISVKALLITIVVLLIILFVITRVADSGILINKEYGNKKYETLEELRKSVDFSFDVPDIILESSIKSYTTEFGLVAYIQCSDKAFKVSKFSHYDVDNLNLYDESSIDKYYCITGNEDIKVIRYRQGYSDVGNNITILNWFSDELEYSIVLYENLSVNEILEKLNIEYSSYKEVGIDELENRTEKEKQSDNESTEGNERSQENEEYIWKVEGIEIKVYSDSKCSFRENENALNIFRNEEFIATLYYYKNLKNLEIEVNNNLSNEENKAYQDKLITTINEWSDSNEL